MSSQRNKKEPIFLLKECPQNKLCKCPKNSKCPKNRKLDSPNNGGRQIFTLEKRPKVYIGSTLTRLLE